MKVLVLYDSKFGNTEKLARAMAESLESSHVVQLQKVGETGVQPAGFDLILMGGPTQGHGMSAPLKEALTSFSNRSAAGIQVAIFDTRFRMPQLLTGSAAASGGKLLKSKGAKLVAAAESFFVTRGGAPALEPGELERAAEWATSAAETVSVVQAA